jgi:enoyl-CoA hydratase/carnithine racemase
VKRYELMAEAALMGIHDFGKPTIAAIRGYCIGGGVNVSISCDLRLATSDSVFAVPASRLGLGYRFSAMKNLVDLVGPGRAKDIFFTARRLDAAEALAIGLVNRVVPPEGLDALLAEYVQMIATGAPLTIKAGKRIMREVLKADADIDTELCRRLILDCFESEDYAEGRTAFMEKRKPVFRGR